MNSYLFQKINSLIGHSYWLDKFMVFSAEWLGYILILGVLLCFFKNRNKYKEMLLVSFVSAIVSRFVFVYIIRFFYYHPRPYLVLQNINWLIKKETESSFPSGHAAFYFSLATGVYLYNKKVGYVYFVLAGLMGFARIFVGVHWPLDILTGAALGIATTWLLNIFYKKYLIKIGF